MAAEMHYLCPLTPDPTSSPTYRPDRRGVAVARPRYDLPVTPVDRARRSAGTGLRRVVPPVAGGLGRLLGRPLAALARWRSGKPMHPRGVVCDAVLERTGSSPPWGVPWLDHPGRNRALLRLSRGAGL